MKKPVLIILRGPAASGKSTIVKYLWKEIPRTALIKLDELKWSVSDYRSDKFDLDLSVKVGLKMTEIYLSSGINVIVEKAFIEKDRLLAFSDYAKENGFSVFVYNIEAPWEVIRERIVSRDQKMTLEKAKSIFDNYKSGIVKVDQTFDTSLLSVKEIVDFVKKDVFRERK